VQARGRLAAGMTGDEPAEYVTGANWLSTMDDRGERLVGSPQATRMVDADHAAARHRTGEVNHAGTGRPDGNARRRGQIDPAVTGQPRLRRRLEPPDHRGHAVQRPPEPDDRHPLRIGKQSKIGRLGKVGQLGKQSKIGRLGKGST
jgi:hypothetical protein